MKPLDARESENLIAPSTSLDIFRIPPFQRDALIVGFTNTDRLKAVTHGVTNSLRRYQDAGKKRYANLELFLTQAGAQARELGTSAAVSEAYFYMDEELRAEGANDEEIRDFFGTALYLNSLIYQNRATHNLEHVSGHLQVSPERANEVIGNAFKKEFALLEKPAWFQHSDAAWESFVRHHASFSDYLPAQRKIRGKTNADFLGIYGRTDPNAYPDWIDEYPTTVPVTVVETEFTQDRQAMLDLEERGKKAINQQKYIRNDSAQRLTDALEIVRIQCDERLTKIPEGFFGSVLLVEATTIPSASPDKHAAQQNKSYIEGSLGAFETQPIALWMESKLKKAGSFPSVADPIPLYLKTLFEDVLQNTDKTSDDPEWQQYLQTDKKLAGFLHYELRPLVAVTRPQDREFTLELLQETSSFEEYLWNYADFLSSLQPMLRIVEERQIPLPSQFLKARRDLEEFSRKWLNQHWRWVYHSLRKAVFNTSTEAQSEKAEPTPSSPVHETEVIDEETQKISQTALDGWNIVYVDNFTYPDDERHTTRLTGETNDALQNNLETYISKNRLSGNPRAELVLAELENAVENMDTTEEQTRWKLITPSGVVYSKRKIGHQRVLYRINAEEKRVVFFLYKKEDKGYRKL